MSTEVDTAFIKAYEDQVHVAYQRKGSKLRNFVRTSTKTPGQDIIFPKIGKGAAKSKPRNGPVEPMNIGHDSKTVSLVDRYAPEYIDKLDQLKTNVDLQRAYAEAAALALGRETDSQITTALDDVVTNTTSINRSAIVIGSLTDWVARLQNREVPTGDGNVFAAVSPMVWSTMMGLQQFANSQWIGPDDLPFKTKMEGKYWNGVTWVTFTGLPGSATARKTDPAVWPVPMPSTATLSIWSRRGSPGTSRAISAPRCKCSGSAAARSRNLRMESVLTAIQPIAERRPPS